MKTHLLVVLLSTSSLFVPTVVLADESSPAPTAPPAATAEGNAYDVRPLAFAGVFWSAGPLGGGGLTEGGGFLAQRGHFEAGLLAQAGQAVLDYEQYSGAGLAGVGWLFPVGLRLDALGEVGVDHYQNVDVGLFSSDPGASGTLPYAGARVGLSVRLLPRGSLHPEVGLWGFAQDDLERETVTYTYNQPEAAGFPTGPTPVSHVVGDARYGGTLTIGLAFDSARRAAR